jgi:undecaprenyl-diphosphatase
LDAHSGLDLTIFHLINGASGHRFLDVISTSVGDNILLRSLVLGCPYIFFWYSRPNVEDRSTIIAGLVAGSLAVVIARILSHTLPFEMRPMFDVESGYHPLSIPFKFDMERWSAFPSDHAALSTGMALGLFRCNKLFSITMAIVALLLFSVPRIYAGIHYPLDIVVGSLIGLACAALTGFRTFLPLWKYIGQLEVKCPSIFYATSFLLLVETSQMFTGARDLSRALRSAFFP